MSPGIGGKRMNLVGWKGPVEDVQIPMLREGAPVTGGAGKCHPKSRVGGWMEGRKELLEMPSLQNLYNTPASRGLWGRSCHTNCDPIPPCSSP